MRWQSGRLSTTFGSSEPACLLVWGLQVLSLCVGLASAMSEAQIVGLRKETVEMFYHGFDNYMNIAFPEDEVYHIRKPLCG
jgi:hypothetical protein